MVWRDPTKETHTECAAVPPSEPCCLAVMYHYVRPPNALAEMAPFGSGDALDAMTVESFEAQLDLLCRHFEPIDWPTFYAWREGRAEVPGRSFLLTFDDGLIDHVRYVAPALERRGLRGVFFVPGFVLAAQNLLCVHMIHLLLARLGTSRFRELLWTQVRQCEPETAAMLADTSWHADAERMYYYEKPERARIKYLLNLQMPATVRQEVLRALFETHVGSPRRWAREWYVGWDELVALEASGHTVGGHGFAHEPYGRLSMENQQHDLNLVAQILREGLGPGARPFSYPYGSVSHETPDLCRSTSFVHGFTTQERWLTAKDAPFLLPRVDTIHVNRYVESEASCRTH